jgi:PTS system nitrogen regulatory IIA component
MNLRDYIKEENIIELEINSSKEEILKYLSNILKERGLINDFDETFNSLMEREKLGSTAVGEEIAIPHAKLADIDDIIILLAISKNGVDFDAVDNKPVKVIFLVLAPEKKMNLHLKTLARISRLIKMTDFKNCVINSENSKEIISCLSEEEAKL